MYKEFIPIINQDKFSYIRKENDDNYTFRMKAGPDTSTKLINSTAMEIIALCDGQNNMEFINKTFKEKYSDVDWAVLSNDINDVLLKFTHLGLVRWLKGNYPFEDGRPELHEAVSDDFYVSMFKEEHFPLIVNFLSSYRLPANNNSFVYTSPFASGSGFDEFNSGMSSFNLNESLFLLFNTKNEIKALIKFVLPVKSKYVLQSSVVSLTAILFEKQKDMKYLPKVLSFCEKKFLALSQYEKFINKIRIAFSSDNFDKNANLINILEACPYLKECKLEKEINNKSIIFYAKTLQ